jgi:Caspase domain
MRAIWRHWRSAPIVAVLSGVLSGSHLTALAAGADSPRNLLVQAAAPALRHEQRLALVIGNSAYKEAPLANPVNDARAMARALQAAGFTVMLRTDVDRRSLLDAVRGFGDRLRQGGAGVFYYAGHGMQIKGRNYLIPIGADIQREDEVAYAALDAQAVLDKMEAAGNGANLMILDACRNNPFARSFRSAAQGLAQMEAPVGTLVAFATAPGSVASDGQGSNGLYTQHLLKAMHTPGAKVEDVFKQVRAGVRRDSLGKQIPWETTSLEGDLYFFNPPVSVPEPAVDPVRAVEQAFWDAVKDTGEGADLRAYLKQFPSGQFAAAARQALAALPALQSEPASAQSEPLSAAIVAQSELAPEADFAELEREQRRREESALAELASDPRAFTVGDKWSFQRVDRWKGEVIRNFTLSVGSVRDNGFVFAGDPVHLHPISRFWRTLQQSAAYGFVAPGGSAVWWGDMKAGEQRKLKLTVDRQRDDLSVVPAELSVQLVHKGRERIRVPAGEFEAVRLDVDGETTTLLGSGLLGLQAWTMRLWYVAELRMFAATETDWRDWNGKLDGRVREELTSFQFMSGPLASR